MGYERGDRLADAAIPTQGGPQRLRFQTREDGVSVDQFVLSAEKYFTMRPGAVKNDTIILPPTLVWQRY